MNSLAGSPHPGRNPMSFQCRVMLPNRTWKSSSPHLKLPPLDQFEALLRTHEVDGEVLLTYDHADLCVDLGLKILKHKSTLKNAIQDIRLHSKKYRLNQKRQASELGEYLEFAGGTKSDEPGEPSEHASPAVKQREESSPDHSALRASAESSRLVVNTSASKAEVSPLVIEEPAPKKRRVAPTTVSANVDRNIVRNIPTEADVISSREGPAQHLSDAADRDLTKQYLGDGAINRIDILDNTSYAEMNLFQVGQMPRGRRLQLHRLMKRHLLRNRNYQRATLAKSDVVPGGDNPDHDEVLPLYGDSDEEYDSETWEEVKAEEQANLTSNNRPKWLTTEEISAVLDETIERLTHDWREYKLPKVARKANRLWNDARRFGLKKRIERVRNDLRHYEARIRKYREEFQGPGQQWRNSGELKRTAAILEQSVVDKEYSSWLLNTLTSPTEPKKADLLPRQSTRRPRTSRPVVEDDEELLTSESEGGSNDFIVDDEDQPPAPAGYGSPMEIIDDVPRAQVDSASEEHRDTTPMDLEVTGYVDLTQEPKNTKASSSTPSRSQKFEIIDLTTPQKQSLTPNIQYSSKSNRPFKTFTIESRGSSIFEGGQSPLLMPVDDLVSRERRVALALEELDQTYLSLIFSLATGLTVDAIWLDFVLRVLDTEDFPKAPYNTYDRKDSLVSYTLIRLFEMYKDDTTYRLSRYKNLDDLGKQRIRALRSTDSTDAFESFVNFLARLANRFDWYQYGKNRVARTPTSPVSERRKKTQGRASTESSDSDPDTTSDMNTDADEPSSSKKSKRKKLVRNQEAANLRETDQMRIAEQARRRQLLRGRLQQLEASGEIDPNSQTAMIINESKSDDQGFIYVHKDIAQRIKVHQLSGVRFMWNQIVDAESRQGCLLAHTMGLGKTMQIITLLVAICQASHSPDQTISSQIPKELRESRTLVLCPPTLVNNWIDELLSWAPEEINLGVFYKLDSTTHPHTREQIIREWGERGGILVVGYSLFKMCVKIPHLERILLDKPSIVVADEAHMLKNPKSQLHMATSNFKTGSRIALTGSPLANNVEEYYSMINWVANNYLGDIREFRTRYSIPIKEGLSLDSSNAQRRKALRMLHVLKSEAAPKVNRITIAVLKNDIPTKKEFVLMVPITELQRKAYEMYIEYRGEDTSSAGTFAATDTLGLICSHPFVFMAKLQELRKIQNGGGNKKNTPNDESVNITLPQQLVNDELALLRNAKKELTTDEFSLSWKIPLLFDILEECKQVQDSVLLFSHQIGTLDYLERALRERKYSSLRLDGQTQMNQRQALVKDFNEGDVDIFLISTAAGGLGLNIVGANRVIIFDVKFNPQAEQQAVGRAYRIGQKKPVFVYRFVCGGTFEEKLLHQAIWKMQLASRVVDKKHPIPKAQRFNEGFGKPEETKQQDLSEHRGKDDVLDNVLERPNTGIRSITMMDTFEEEALEDAELSPEDRQEADRIIQENEARRLGRPIPHHHGLAHGYSDVMPGSGFGPSIDLTGIDVLPVTPLVGRPASTSGRQSTQANPELTMPNTNAPPTQAPEYIHNVTSQSRVMSPVQGTIPHWQTLASPVDSAVPIPSLNWETWQSFKGELARAFTKNTVNGELDERSEISQTVARKVWERAEQQQPELRGAKKWAVMNAASSPRFVEALCTGIIDSDQLAQMPPAEITAQRTTWDSMGDTEWEGYKNSTNHQSNGDPKHLEYALRRMTSMPEDDHTQAQRSHRVDDQKAVEAVLERRKAKQYSQPKPGLPNWAKNAVAKSTIPKQGQISAPSSASSQPSSSSRPSARDPFK